MNSNRLNTNARPKRAVLKAILHLLDKAIDHKEIRKRSNVDAKNLIYGTVSFELVCQMIDELSPTVNQDTKFTDLGSGVGLVVLAVAGLVDCTLCTGVEMVPARSK